MAAEPAREPAAPPGPAAEPAREPAAPQRRPAPHVAVVGAGAFGGWAALMLRRRGARVTLLDAWGPGNPRASSHGETRVIRAMYGGDRVMTALAARALTLWGENERRLGGPLYRRTGALWMIGADDSFVRAALPTLRDAGLAVDEMTPVEAATRWPQVSFEGVRRVVVEREAGYLHALEACAAVARAFVGEGGEYRLASAEPDAHLPGSPPKSAAIEGMSAGPLRLGDGTTLAADQYVFACGPWLGRLFPALIGDRVRPTRQETFVFGPAPGDARFTDDALPVWVDLGERIFYGVPAGGGRGFKVADDTRGPEFDPTAGDRTPGAAGAAAARAFVARRFPALATAPIVEASVCQYENTPDRRFIVDRHPHAANVFVVGGGSGHGFKMGPAIGEMVAEMVLERRPATPELGLRRLLS